MRGLFSRFDHPLLRVGTTLMFVALGCAVLVLAYAFTGGLPERADAAVRPLTKTAAKGAPEPLVRTDPGISPWVEKDIPPPRPEPAPEPRDDPGHVTPAVSPQAAPTPDPTSKPEHQQRPQPRKYAPSGQNAPSRSTQQSHSPTRTTHFHMPPGAIMTLTIPELGIRNAPVINSASKSALDRGVVHLPDTSLPWSDTPERNVYLAGHRLGWPGTGSHLIFYRLGELTGGEKVILHGPNGEYTYRVLGNFTVGPKDSWVTGRVRNRDLLTLQTCTPIPTFQKRLIVRAERV